MRKIVKKILRSHCPNIPALRNKLTQIKLREINKYIMEPQDISAGEASFEKRTQIVEKYSDKWEKYTRELIDKFNEYALRSTKVASRTDKEALRTNALFACFAYGFLPDEFFVYELEHKSPEEIKEYISNRELSNYIYEHNDIIDIDIFLNKYKTYSRFKPYFRREAVSCAKNSDFGKFSEFVKKHPVYVRKNVGLSKGDSVELIDSRAMGKSERQLFDEMLSAGSYIVEERVIQSDQMSRLNPSSVNTVRCITFMTDAGAYIGPCFLKVGRGNSFVDNGGKGGILIGINGQTGVLDTIGYDEFLNEYPQHPDTKHDFKGFQLPEWNELKKLAIEASNQIPRVKYIGWDFAHTAQGWVIIEGNGCSQVVGPQIVWRRGFKKDFAQILK